MDTAIRARGVNFLYAKEYVLKEHGEDFWKSLIDSIPEESARSWRGPILSLKDYPFEDFKAMVRKLSEMLHSEEVESLSELYAFIADRSLNSLYKIFFRLSQPSFVLKNYPKLWDRFFTSGEVTVPEADKNNAVIRFKLPETFLDWLPGACYGYSKKAIEMAGGKSMRMTERSKRMLDDGEYEIVYELEWK